MDVGLGQCSPHGGTPGSAPDPHHPGSAPDPHQQHPRTLRKEGQLGQGQCLSCGSAAPRGGPAGPRPAREGRAAAVCRGLGCSRLIRWGGTVTDLARGVGHGPVRVKSSVGMDPRHRHRLLVVGGGPHRCVTALPSGRVVPTASVACKPLCEPLSELLKRGNGRRVLVAVVVAIGGLPSCALKFTAVQCARQRTY